MNIEWSKVGDWLKDNAASGVGLVGSLISGNVPGAIAAGVAMVSSATGTTDPGKALETLKSDPATMIRLQELANAEATSIREHIASMHAADLADKQAEHAETQGTIRNGDNADDVLVRRTRPLQSWASLIAAFAWVFYKGVSSDTDVYVLGLLLTLPWAYAGLREVGKGLQTWKGGKV
jgi:hypothetical protein